MRGNWQTDGRKRRRRDRSTVNNTWAVIKWPVFSRKHYGRKIVFVLWCTGALRLIPQFFCRYLLQRRPLVNFSLLTGSLLPPPHWWADSYWGGNLIAQATTANAAGASLAHASSGSPGCQWHSHGDGVINAIGGICLVMLTPANKCLVNSQ